MLRSHLLTLSLIALFVSVPSVARALNKQGAPLGVSTSADGGAAAQEVALTGYVFSGALVYNPSYAARPDNSGRALMRTGAHLDLALSSPALILTYDANVFSDGQAASRVRPSELDHLVGVLLRRGALEAGGHWETDRPADRPGAAQSYVDLHLRAYADLGRLSPRLAARWPKQRLSGYATLGGFVFNRTYAARPDLSGLALLRLAGHLDLDVFAPWVTFSVDLNAFTDRQSHAGLLPSELDTTVGLTLHVASFDVSAVAENDRPLDRAGLQQSYVSALLTYHFDVMSPRPDSH